MKQINKSIKNIISSIGDEPLRNELKKTPKRAILAYKNIFSGYFQNPEFHLNSFSKAENNDIILFDKIDFYSTCEHHLMPFFGQIQIAYIPKQNAIGFGTIEKIVKSVTRKLQIQERIAKEIAIILQESKLQPAGVYVSITGNHFCVLSKNDENSKPSVLKNIFTTEDFKKPENIAKLGLIF